VCLQLTTACENSSGTFDYNYAENIGDGRGITFGAIGFTTGTYDGNELIKYYTQLNPNNSLAKYIPALDKIDSGKHDADFKNDDVTGLGVCKIFCVFFLWINAKTTDLLNEAHKVTCRFDY